MSNMIKYILIQIELLLMLGMFILGIAAAESQMWGQAVLLILAPFVLGAVCYLKEQIHFCEVYSRALNIKLNIK